MPNAQQTGMTGPVAGTTRKRGPRRRHRARTAKTAVVRSGAGAGIMPTDTANANLETGNPQLLAEHLRGTITGFALSHGISPAQCFNSVKGYLANW